MKVDLSKTQLIRLVTTAKPKSMEECIKLTEIKLMKFTGNQWNENWSWDCEALNNLPEEALLNIYNTYSNEKLTLL